MNIPEPITEKLTAIRGKLDALREKIAATVNPGHKKTFAVVTAGILVLLALSGFIIVAVQSGNAPPRSAKQKRVKNSPEKTYTVLHPILPPVPAEQHDYLLFRSRRQQWDEQDAAQWYTAPTEAMMDQLHVSNNSLINNLLDSVP
jgi:hypothetical protein